MYDVELTIRGPRVIVATEDQTEYQHPSGLIAVASHAPEVIGTVIAVGEVHEVQPGDVVLFPPSAGRELEWNGCRFLVLDEDEIVAIWDEDQKGA